MLIMAGPGPLVKPQGKLPESRTHQPVTFRLGSSLTSAVWSSCSSYMIRFRLSELPIGQTDLCVDNPVLRALFIWHNR